MPSRILREGILTSERVDRLTAWASEVFYRRLMSVVDDFGRYYANPTLLRAACYPLRLDKVSNADVEKWLADCAGAALISTYEIGGKRYLQMLDFRQQERAKQSKFPPPPSECAAGAQQVIGIGVADVPVVVDGFESGDEAPKPRSRTRRQKIPLPPQFGLSERVIEWAKSKGYGSLQQHLDAFRLKAIANDYRYSDWDHALMNAIESDWAGVRTGRRAAVVATAPKWRPGGEPTEVLNTAARSLQLDPWQPDETQGQFRARIVSAGGEELLKPGKVAA